jgi:hypothetical protein
MSDAALDHRLIREYLRQLDSALYTLPSVAARELREQIIAHLDDALGPEASDAEIAGVLRRLGSPGELAAELASTVLPPPTPAARRRPARISHRTWILSALAMIAVVLVGAKWADHYWSAAPLAYDNGAEWWYQQDVSHEVNLYANGTSQSTVPARPGQPQGYVVMVTNQSAVSETIVGDGNSQYGWNNPGSQAEQLSVSTTPADIAVGVWGQSAAGHAVFTLPVTIPPGQSRMVRVLWTTNRGLCLTKGESAGISTLALRVRTGWVTRTQTIPQPGWYLAGVTPRNCS